MFLRSTATPALAVITAIAATILVLSLTSTSPAQLVVSADKVPPPPSPHPPTLSPTLSPAVEEAEKGGEGETGEKGELDGIVSALATVAEQVPGLFQRSDEAPESRVDTNGCGASCGNSTCGKLSESFPLTTCSGFEAIGCDCTGCCVPVSSPSPPLPPPAMTCDHPCSTSTCGVLGGMEGMTCGFLSTIGCDCTACCDVDPSPPPAPPSVPIGCPARQVRQIFAGTSVQFSDGALSVEEGEEGEEAKAAKEITTELIDSPFTSTFYNMTCLQAGVTGDPCDEYVVEAYFAEILGGLAIVYMLSIVAAGQALFSTSQLGGIPRPSDRRGIFFWAAWMFAQALQWLVVASSLIMHVAAYFSLRKRLEPCAIVDERDGTMLLDAFAMSRWGFRLACLHSVAPSHHASTFPVYFGSASALTLAPTPTLLSWCGPNYLHLPRTRTHGTPSPRP